MERPSWQSEVQQLDLADAAGAAVAAGGVRGAAGLADHRQQALGLPAVRPHRRHQHDRAARPDARASCASRAPRRASRCRSTATAASATSIPYRGAMLAVAESARNVACAGGEPIGATNNLNFGNPERPEIMWQFGEAVRGHRRRVPRARRARSPAATSASTTRPTAGRSIRRRCSASSACCPTRRAPSRAPSRSAGAAVIAPGRQSRRAGRQRSILARVMGRVQGAPPALDLDAERALQQLIVSLVRRAARAVGARLLRRRPGRDAGGMHVRHGRHRRGVQRRRAPTAPSAPSATRPRCSARAPRASSCRWPTARWLRC